MTLFWVPLTTMDWNLMEKKTFCPTSQLVRSALAGEHWQNIDIERLLEEIGLGISKSDAKRFCLPKACEFRMTLACFTAGHGIST